MPKGITINNRIKTKLMFTKLYVFKFVYFRLYFACLLVVLKVSHFIRKLILFNFIVIIIILLLLKFHILHAIMSVCTFNFQFYSYVYIT